MFPLDDHQQDLLFPEKQNKNKLENYRQLISNFLFKKRDLST
jgi:hypothetical protein